MKLRFAITFLVFVSTFDAFSQSLSQSNWYFGNTVNGIRFNRSSGVPALVNNQAIPYGIAGSAVATDPSTANLLFYSDGSIIYDGYHLPMLNGGGLGGNNSGNQSVVICPVPGQTNKYFVFTNSANFLTGGTITQSVVNMNLFGNEVFPAPPFGDVENPKNVAIPGLTGRSEGMTIVPHANKTDFWLITHQGNSISYSATLINAAAYTGTFNTTVSTTGNLPLTIANFSYHQGLGKMAISPQRSKENAIIFDFDDTNGTFSFDRFIFNTGYLSVSNQEIYDIEWSMSGQYLYISRPGEAGVTAEVLQYDYLNSNTSTPSTIITSVLGAPVFRSYGLQMAADNAMYYLYQSVSGGPFLVDKFLKTDTIASRVIRQSLPFGNVNFGGQQFPFFTPLESIPLTVSFTTIGSCQNTPTSFFPTVAPAADSLVWDFGDMAGVNSWSPIHTYKTTGTFNATLKAFYQGLTQTVTQPVTINAFALKLNLVQDTAACRSEFPPPRGSSSPKQFSVKVKVQGGTPTSYAWSNGDFGDTLTPDLAGYYYVVVSDASGCSAYAGVNVKEYDLQDGRGNIWYFGNKAGINFNPLFSNSGGPALAVNNSAMTAPEGCTIICDRSGQTILYTDGDKVYDKTNTQIDLGIGGDPTSSQSSLIVPVPGDETLYYIFTTQAINGTSANELRYSLFDLKQNSGNGAVVQKNILLFGRSTERITANGTWLIAHEYGNNTFRSYQVTADGIGAPVYSSIGSDHSFKIQQNGEGYMKLGPRNNLAVAISTPGSQNLIELFNLDNATGKLTNYRKIDLKQATGQVYGIEFSPAGNKLFATVKGTPSPSELYEYFIDSIQKPYFRQKITQPVELGAMQLGPDGQIYGAINGSGVLGTINANEDTTKVSSYNPSGFTLASGTTSALGLPNFIQIVSNAFGGPAIDVTGLCFGDSTRFVGTATDAIDNFQWFFGDGGSDNNNTPNPVHLYAATGTYTVSLRITNRCSLDTTLTRNIRITTPPARPTLAGATALCTGTVTLDANNTNQPGLTYLWATGETTKTIVVNDNAFISVVNTDVNGCTSTAQTIVADNRPQLDLGPDVSLCEDNSTPALNAQNPGATYQWTINGVNSSNSQAQAVDATTPGVFTYKVTVRDPITTCTVTDSKTYTIKVSPSFTLTGTDPLGCGLANGTLQLKLLTSAPVGGPYSFFVSGAGGFNDQQIDQTAPNTINYNNPANLIPVGTYSGIVTDQISGCTISTSIGLSDAIYTPTSTPAVPNCDPVIVNVISNAPASSLPLSYIITNIATGTVIGPNASATVNFSTPGLAAGNYVIKLTDNTGCVSTINQAIIPNAQVAIALTPDACAIPATITGSGATTYSWTGPGLFGPFSGAILSIPLGQVGLLTYTVTATTAGKCPATQPVNITVNPVSFTVSQSSSICAGTFTILTASGANSYSWSPAAGLSSTTGNSIIARPTTTTTYTVTGNTNSCSSTTATVTVTVNIPCSVPNLANGSGLESYRIFSIPLKFVDNRIETVLSSVMNHYNGYDQDKWRLVHYLNGNNLNFTEGLSTIDAGNGYWLLSVDPLEINVSGTSLNVDQSTPFVMTLGLGWNQIGNPFGFDVSWNDVLDQNSNPSTVGKLFVYDPVSISFKESDNLKAWGGGFVNTTVAKQLSIPVTVKQATGGRVSASSELVNNSIDESSWFVPLKLEHAGASNDMGGIGMHVDALSGRDKYDENSLPRFVKFLELNSYHEEYFQPRFMRDVVTLASNHNWNLVVESNFGEGDATLSWDHEALNQNEAILFLYDKESNVIVDMKKVGEYKFRSTGKRNLTIMFAIDTEHLAPESVMLGLPFPNPFSQQTTIPFISRLNEGEIVISIYDMLGRKVNEVPRSNYKAGYNEVIWDGGNYIGEHVTPGMYIIKIVSSKSSGMSTRIIVK